MTRPNQKKLLTPLDGCIVVIATMDEEGYINVGRIKDMIIRGGENIYPKVIEEFLYIKK
jgi:non-ribosomal peptide synthetase component E (peptide arylation enzyme)